MLALILVLLGAMSSEAVQTPVAATSARAQLVLTLHAEKTAFVLYEPISLTYRVQNPTTNAITAKVLMDQSAQAIKFLITGPDQNTSEYYGGGASLVPARDTACEPGMVVESAADLHSRVFPMPGEYEIRAKLWVGDDPAPVFLESNRLVITIQETTERERDAIAFFSSTDEFQRLLQEGAAAYCRGRDGAVCFEELMRFVEQHGTCAYAPRIVWYLATALKSGRIDVTPKYELAVGLYRQFLERWPNHPDAPRVMYGLASALDSAGMYEEAMETILELEARFPGEKEKSASLRKELESGKMIGPK